MKYFWPETQVPDLGIKLFAFCMQFQVGGLGSRYEVVHFRSILQSFPVSKWARRPFSYYWLSFYDEKRIVTHVVI